MVVAAVVAVVMAVLAAAVMVRVGAAAGKRQLASPRHSTCHHPHTLSSTPLGKSASALRRAPVFPSAVFTHHFIAHSSPPKPPLCRRRRSSPTRLASLRLTSTKESSGRPPIWVRRTSSTPNSSTSRSSRCATAAGSRMGSTIFGGPSSIAANPAGARRVGPPCTCHADAPPTPKTCTTHLAPST